MPTQSTETLIEEAVQNFKKEFNCPIVNGEPMGAGELLNQPIELFLRDALRTIATKSAEDTKRLDFLDKCNLVLNRQFETDYGWELIINQNITRLMIDRGLADIDLNDAKAGKDKLKSCRDAIDKKMETLSQKEQNENQK